MKWTSKLLGRSDEANNSNQNHPQDNTPVSPQHNHAATTHCRCCGTILSYPSNINRLKCLTCNTYITLDQSIPFSPSLDSPVMSNPSIPLASLSHLNSAIKLDQNVARCSNEQNTFENVNLLIEKSFGNLTNLNSCFLMAATDDDHYPSLDVHEIRKFYHLLIKLPSQRPVYKLLVHSLYLLKHPPLHLDPTQFNWILIIFEMPLLYECLLQKNTLSYHFNDLCYDIIERIIGITSLLDKPLIKQLTHFWSNLSASDFSHRVDFLNLYITVNISKLFSGSESVSSSLSINTYSDSWYLKTSCHLMSYLFYTNSKYNKIDESCFYNNLVDCIHTYQDFDVWQFNNRIDINDDACENILLMERNRSYFGISVLNGVYKKTSFTFCSYPFLISLGSKINILKYYSKKVMGMQAEEAFISSFTTGNDRASGISFRLPVRRELLLHDSIKQILKYPNDIRKVLKVEFINEQGIDGGGLKKEWFLLLVKELFDPSKGLISYNNENKFAYFAINNTDNNELCYFLGIVIGMAIYNSIILDIKFPNVIYRKLLGYKSCLQDLKEFEPTIYDNLKKLSQMDNIEALELYFEIDIKDIHGVTKTYELIPDGSKILVSNDNKLQYINKYSSFLIDEAINRQFVQFLNGFRHVMGTKLIELFTATEIRKLITGSDNNGNSYDLCLLRSICKYRNCNDSDVLVNNFWKYFESLSFTNQQKLMRFITCTDRIPTTGLSTMDFKITKLKDKGVFSTRLPISHTCFNELCLWEYENFETLKRKLDLAVFESGGFELK